MTCYPFHFVGRAPKRFLVRAHRTPCGIVSWRVGLTMRARTSHSSSQYCTARCSPELQRQNPLVAGLGPAGCTPTLTRMSNLDQRREQHWTDPESSKGYKKCGGSCEQPGEIGGDRSEGNSRLASR